MTLAEELNAARDRVYELEARIRACPHKWDVFGPDEIAMIVERRDWHSGHTYTEPALRMVLSRKCRLCGTSQKSVHTEKGWSEYA